jgi:hypothetical protein
MKVFPLYHPDYGPSNETRKQVISLALMKGVHQASKETGWCVNTVKTWIRNIHLIMDSK